MKRRRFRIYYANAEYAREMGDPCLGTVVATSKEEAEQIARMGKGTHM